MSKKFSEVVESAREGMLEEGTEFLPFLPVSRMADRNKFLAYRNKTQQGELESDENYRARMILIGEYEKAFAKSKTYQNGMNVGLMNYDVSNYGSILTDSTYKPTVNKAFRSEESENGIPFVPILDFGHDIDFNKAPENQSSFFTECERRYKPQLLSVRELTPNHTYSTVPNMEGVKSRFTLVDFAGAPTAGKLPVIYSGFAGNGSAFGFDNLVSYDRTNYHQCIHEIFAPIISDFNFDALASAIAPSPTPTSPSPTPTPTPTSPSPGVPPPSPTAPLKPIIGTPSAPASDVRLTGDDANRYYQTLVDGVGVTSPAVLNFIQKLVYLNVEGRTLDVLRNWVSNVKTASGVDPKQEDFGGIYATAFGVPQYPIATQQNAQLVNLYFNGVKQLCSNKFPKIEKDLFFATPEQMKVVTEKARRNIWQMIGATGLAQFKSMVANAVTHPWQTFKSIISGARNMLSKIHSAAENGPMRYH